MTLDERHRLHDRPYELGEMPPLRPDARGPCDLCTHDARRRNGRKVAAWIVFALCVTIFAWVKA